MSHRIYRKLYDVPDNPSTLTGLVDELTGASIPLDEKNASYIAYLALLDDDRALALDIGEDLPVDVTATDEQPPITFSPGRPPDPA